MRTAFDCGRYWAGLVLAMGCLFLLGLHATGSELIVEIIDPEDGTLTASTDQAQLLRAVAYLVSEEGTSEVDADITWDFGDGTTADGVAYTAHRWDEAGEYPVTVSAQWGDLEATDEASATVQEADTTLSTSAYVYGLVPPSFAEEFREAHPTCFPLLARRVTDGLTVWCTHTYMYHYPTVPDTPGVYYTPCPPLVYFDFEEGDVVYAFYHGDLPPGTYELLKYGSVEYCGTWSVSYPIVTVCESDTYYGADRIRRDLLEPIFLPGGSTTVSRGVCYGDDTPAAGTLVQASGFSVAGCQATSGEDGSYTLTDVVWWNTYVITAQKSGYATSWLWDDDYNLVLRSVGTPSFGRVVGTLNLDGDDGARKVFPYCIDSRSTGLEMGLHTEYSLIMSAGERRICLTAAWKVSTSPYGRVSNPVSPYAITVPVMGQTQVNFCWGEYYGIVWGRLTDPDGIPQVSGIVRFWSGDTLTAETETLVRTDEHGYYVIRLKNGTNYHVRGEAWDWDSYYPQAFSAEQGYQVNGQNTQLLNLTVDPEIPVYWNTGE